MQYHRLAVRSFLLGLSMLSACAAAQPNPKNSGAYTDGPAGAFLAGRAAESADDMDAAAQSYARVLATDPNDAILMRRAFVTSLLAGRPEAVTLARRLQQDDVARLVLADADIRNGDWAGAEQRFATLPREDLLGLLRPILIAWTQQGAGHPDVALATLRPFIEGQRLRAIYALNGAAIADLAGETAEASRLYRIAQAESGGTGLQLARMQASWLARQGNPTEAGEALTALVTLDPDMAICLPALRARMAERPIRRAADGIAEAYLTLATALRQQPNSQQSAFSEILARLALDLRPDLTPARLLYADILASKRNPDAALQMLAPVTSDDPLLPLVQTRRTLLLDATDRKDDAMAVLVAMAAAHPNRPEPLTMQGNLLRAQLKFHAAVAAYDKAVALVPNPTATNWPLFYQRGIVLERDHQWDRAEADFTKALELAPDQPSVLNYLGYSWAEQGRNLNRAREMIERAVAQRPNDGAFIDSLGWVIMKQGNPKEALPYLERAVELEPTDPSINGHLGDAYAANGRLLEAQFQWRRALTLKPEPQEQARLEALLRDSEQTLSASAK